VPRTIVLRSHEVCCPLSATQPSRSTTPGRLPARVTLRPHAYHAPRRLTPSAASLVSLSTRCAHGVLEPCRACPDCGRGRLSVSAAPRDWPCRTEDRRIKRGSRCSARRSGLVSGDVPQPVGAFRAGYSPLLDGPGSPGFGLPGALPFRAPPPRSTVTLLRVSGRPRRTELARL